MLLSTLFSEVLFVEFVKREHWDRVSYVSYSYCYVTMITRALKCKPSAQIMRDDREVYCNYQVVDVYISGIIVKQLYTDKFKY